MIDLKYGDIKEPLPKRILDKLCRNAFRDVTLYPKNYDALISKLAKRHNVKPENVILTNGVDEGIELIARLFGENILIFPPTYYEFLDAPRRNNLKYEMINCFDGNDYSLKYREDDVKNRSLIFLCNPNNPFGLLSKEEIIGIAKKTNGIVAVDETYIDFNGETVINEFENVQNLLILRSFSKGYSLAGLRIGYVAGKEGLIEKIRQRKLICNVSSVSVNAAVIALEEGKYFRNLINKIKKRKDDFENFLRQGGFNTIHTHTNDVIIKFGKPSDADKFCSFLGSRKVIVNQGNGISTCGLDKSFVRFACGMEKQMKKVKRIIDLYENVT